MKKNIRDLTNTLIGRHGFHCLTLTADGQFIARIKNTLECSDVALTTPETLGRIISSFEVPDIDGARLEVDTEFYEAGACNKLLVEIAIAFLAQAIFNRLRRWEELHLPAYKPAKSSRKSRR